MRIVLIGYMGSGKTTIGKLLSLNLKFKFYDLDKYITIQEDKSIKDIFLTKGENYFRKIESYSLKSILELEKKCVISSGGGTPCYNNNFLLMKRLSWIVYLKLSPKLIFHRLKNEKTNRPIISNLSDKDLYKFILKNFSQRTSYYEKADYKLDVTNKSPEQIVYYIQKKLL